LPTKLVFLFGRGIMRDEKVLKKGKIMFEMFS